MILLFTAAATDLCGLGGGHAHRLPAAGGFSYQLSTGSASASRIVTTVRNCYDDSCIAIQLDAFDRPASFLASVVAPDC